MQIHTNSLLFSFSKALDFVEADLLGVTTNHSKRAAFICMHLANSLNFNQTEIFDLASCAVLHDNALTEYMLANKKDGLKKLENIQEHCLAGERNARNFPFVGDAQDIILNHHENWNGTGFFKLQGHEYSLRSAILRMADNIDLRFALGTKAHENMEKVIEHVQRNREILYAPDVVDAFLSGLSTDFINCLSNEQIDAGLESLTPPIVQDLSIDQLLQTTAIFSQIIDAKSPFTLNHSKGIAKIAGIMSKFYGFDSEHSKKFVMAAHMHDIGKLTIPSSILDKPGALTTEEFKVMKTHAQASYDVLSLVQGLEDITEWACSHHEKLDGSGYPRGLNGKALCLEARLLSCIDIYQALTEDRPYRQGLSHEKAISIMQNMADTEKIDPKILPNIDKVLSQI